MQTTKPHISLKKAILCLLSLTLFISAKAQYLPFQGKLANASGLALTGSYAFTFNVLGTTWSETYTNLPVNNGLFAVMLGSINSVPSNLFSNTNVRQLKITVNGTPMDTVAIVAPIVGRVSWSHLDSIPAGIFIDSDNQTMSVNGNQLSISGGNTVTLATTATHLDSIQVGQSGLVTSMAASVVNTNISQTSVTSVWQSFTPTQSGTLQNIKAYFANFNSSDVRLKIYPGTGNNGQSFYNVLYSCNTFSATYNQQTFPITGQTIYLQSGVTYTFELICTIGTSCGGSFAGITVGYNNANPYAGGQANIGSIADLIFDVAVGNVVNPVFTANHNGNGVVGIGNVAPFTSNYMLNISGGTSKDFLFAQQDKNSLSYVDFYNASLGTSAGSIIRLITQQSANVMAIVDMVKYQTGAFNMSNNDINGSMGFNVTAGGNSPSMDLYIANNGNIGIGTTTPNMKLHVAGAIKSEDRIYDKTGVVMPVGSMIAFAGTTPPQGWLLCDGASISTTQYADLYAAIGNNWGASGSNFNIPDTRGVFLRGVDGNANKDPDKNSRTASNAGGNTGNAAGTYQDDTFKAHEHLMTSESTSPYPNQVPSATNYLGNWGAWGQIPNIPNNNFEYRLTGTSNPPTTCRTSAAGGGETHPKNVYVNYIIKY